MRLFRQHKGTGQAKLKGQVRRQVPVGDTPDPICSEQSCHIFTLKLRLPMKKAVLHLKSNFHPGAMAYSNTNTLTVTDAGMRSSVFVYRSVWVSTLIGSWIGPDLLTPPTSM